jgi:uncharacterized protein (DUF1501 family)
VLEVPSGAMQTNSLAPPIGRRLALGQFGTMAVMAALPWPLFALAASDPRFVFIRLAGAMDGLAAVPPYGDRDYRSARGALALPRPEERNGVLDLDGFFGLHPSLTLLHEFYAKRELLVLPATATAHRGVSHSLGQQALESGWLDRAGLINGAAMSLGEADRRGAGLLARLPSAAPPTSLELNLALDLTHGNPTFARELAESTWGRSVMRSASGQESIEATIKRRAFEFVILAAEAGKLLSAQNGPRVAVIECGGWDTHANQGVVTGRLATSLAALAAGLQALAVGCGRVWRQTIVLVATEFGRAVSMNTMEGTDHGVASASFLIGGAVAGGRVLGHWPGLKAEQLTRDGALAPTTDLRAVFKSVLVGHLGLPRDAVENDVFPGSANVRPLQNLFRT